MSTCWLKRNSHTVDRLLSEHGRLRVFSPQAVGMWRADVLRARRAAAVVKFWLINVRQKALVAVFICEHITWPLQFLKQAYLCIKYIYISYSSWFESQCALSLPSLNPPKNLPVKSSIELVFSITTSLRPRTSPLVDLVRNIYWIKIDYKNILDGDNLWQPYFNMMHINEFFPVKINILNYTLSMSLHHWQTSLFKHSTPKI